MMNRPDFYAVLRPVFGPLTTGQVMGCELILNEMEKRETDLNEGAYYLATAYWESGKTLAPVREAYYLGSKAEAARRKMRYYPYYGRGLVQLTHRENYLKYEKILGIPLVSQPDLALEPRTSVLILFHGMETGTWTGKKASDYIDDIDESDDEDLREFANARRVVNGTDKQVEIGKIALLFEKALRAANYGGRVPVSRPKPVETPIEAPVVSAGLSRVLVIIGVVTLLLIVTAVVWRFVL